MVLSRIQVQILIAQLKNISLNQPVHMEDPVNCVIGPFEGNINPVYPQGFKLYLKVTQ